MATSVQNIQTSLIDNPGHDSRMGHDEAQLNDLKESIREHGILQPLLVRPRDSRYEVIAGNRRLQVARSIGLTEVPAMVRDAGDTETAIWRFEENLKRANINPVEEAKYIAESIGLTGLEVVEFAAKIGRTVQWIENRLTIAEMPAFLQAYVGGGHVPLGVALHLQEIGDEIVKKNWSDYAAESGMTVAGAKDALHEWQKMARRREDAPEGSELPPVPSTPPVVMKNCEKCGDPQVASTMRYVAICYPVCPESEGPGT